MAEETREERYQESLEGKGLTTLRSIIPKKWKAHFTEEIKKVREEHLKNLGGK